MASRAPTTGVGAPVRGRCRCGHLATHHVVVRPMEGSASFRLDPTGPCAVCGEAACRRFSGDGG